MARAPLLSKSPAGPQLVRGKGFRHKYGIHLAAPCPDWYVELVAWDRPYFDTGLEKIAHLRKCLDLLQPDSKWQEWRDIRFRSLTEPDFAERLGNTSIRNINWVGPGAAGKAQPLDAIVQTPLGPVQMGNLEIGQEVCAADGTAARVIGIFPQGPKEVFEITLADGSKTRCCRDHLWKIIDPDRTAPFVTNTSYLIENFSIYRGARIRKELTIPFANPAHFNAHPVKVHPYVTGSLIGDGSFGARSGKSGLRFTTSDFESLDKISKLLVADYSFKRCGKSKYDYQIRRDTRRGTNAYIQAFRNWGLWGKLSDEKFIPEEYLVNSLEVRMELIQGLFDTDGSVHRGCAKFHTTSKKLAEQVRFLIQSIGGSCRIRPKQPFFKYLGVRKPGKIVYNCSVQIADPSILFSLSRKKNLTQKRKFGRKGRSIEDVRSIGVQPVQCILIDHPEHLYLTDDFIPTHNTNDAGVFAFHWFLADPQNTCVALTSTSKGKMRQRVWPIIQECWINYKAKTDELGGQTDLKMLNSSMELRFKDDSKRSIFGQAVEPGEIATALEKLKGVHAPRIMLVIDEAPGVEEAVFRCIPNMLKGCEDFALVNIGNGPLTHLDPFSRVCTPVQGWSSVTVDSERWRTKAVPEYQLPSGWCFHFDGTKSPNVKAGRTLYPFLYTWENWLRVKDDPVIQRTPEFWSQDRGFWPPEGFVNTVLTEEDIERGNARGEILFDGPTITIGSVDPAFGGDDCILRFGKFGKLASGKKAIQITERIVIPVLVDAVDREGKKLTIDQQIADKVFDEARKRGVKPHHFGVEATGTGRSIGAFLTQQWGEIVWVESGGKPSSLPASEEDPRLAKDVYDRKITELWFSVQAFVRGGQLGGMCDEDVVEFCSRTYDYVNKKYYLEKKEDLKPRLGRSPDSADSLAVMIEVARRHGMQTIGPRGDRMLSMWDREITIQNRLYSATNLYLPERCPTADD